MFLVKKISTRYNIHMKGEHTYALLERLANLLRAEERRFGAELGLQPVHIHALSFLARANRYSNTPAAVAEYLGLTKGTVSQTLIVLTQKGLVRNGSNPRDRRRVHFELTKAGKHAFSRLIPPEIFKNAEEKLLMSLDKPLEGLLREIQMKGDYRTFGVCKTCRFLQS
ncbi:MAG: MarR family winged helix-turn-helix transcriptional regulator, partial [Candidatus Zixiibacteriota bacterium]